MGNRVDAWVYAIFGMRWKASKQQPIRDITRDSFQFYQANDMLHQDGRTRHSINIDEAFLDDFLFWCTDSILVLYIFYNIG